MRTKPRPDERIRRIIQICVIVDVREDTRDLQAWTALGGETLAKQPGGVAQSFFEFFDGLVQRIHILILRSHECAVE
jgi:hypothetical protein